MGSQDWRDRAGHRLRSRVARRGLDTATCHLGIGDVSLEHSVPSTAPGRWNKSVRAHVRRATVANGPYWCRGSVRGTARRPACPRVRGPCCRSLTPSGCAPKTAPAKRMEREQELESPPRVALATLCPGARRPALPGAHERPVPGTVTAPTSICCGETTVKILICSFSANYRLV